MPTAQVGPENPLPPLFSVADMPRVVDTAAADAEMRRNIGYGRVSTVLPYLVQDGYGRSRRPAEHKVAVLENDVLRATFLLDLGGRLWSLVHKPTGRELLHRNPVFQPANLALRNAWFAGGVEWNIGTIGHSPTTCEPLHAARVAAAGRHADLADVRVRAVARSRLPGRRLAARGLPGAAGPRPDPQSQRRRGTPSTGGPTSPCPSRTTFASSHPRTRPGSSPTTGASVGCRSPSSTDGTAPTRRARRRPPTTSSRSTTTSVAGSLRWTAAAPDWCRPRPTCFAAASCSCGEGAPAATTGRSGSPGRARSTSRSRPDWPGPSSSTCRCRDVPRGPGSRRTDCSRATRTPSTRPTGPWRAAR